MKTSVAIGVVAALVVAGGAYWYYFMPASPSSDGVVCTMEAMQCPDGSYVGRSGPTCAFAPCPGASGAAGINGSANQGNMGQPANGTPQQPMADGAEGSIIGANLALGTNSNVTLGKYLNAYNGMTLYTYSPDKPGVSNCTGQCAVNWPPYLVGPEDNLTQLQAGVTGKVDTTTRADGTLQVTYNGDPLYFYIKDAKAGDTTGQGVGGVWFVVKP